MLYSSLQGFEYLKRNSEWLGYLYTRKTLLNLAPLLTAGNDYRPLFFRGEFFTASSSRKVLKPLCPGAYPRTNQIRIHVLVWIFAAPTLLFQRTNDNNITSSNSHVNRQDRFIRDYLTSTFLVSFSGDTGILICNNPLSNFALIFDKSNLELIFQARLNDLFVIPL